MIGAGENATAVAPSDGELDDINQVEPVDPEAIVAEVRRDYDDWSTKRKPFEAGWFVAAAFLRGQQNVVYNESLGRLVTPIVPSYRIQASINRIRPKVKGRLAKFFKSKPKPTVISASTERKAIMNAKASEKALSYTWYRQSMEQKHKDARLWATVGSKGFWWIRWNDHLMARVQTKNAITGVNEVQAAPLGDVEIEVGSPFEVFVGNPNEPRIGKQERIIRARLRSTADVQARYPDLTKLADAQVVANEAPIRVPDRIGRLNNQQGNAMMVGSSKESHDKHVLVIEHFVAPCAKYAKGRYVVVVGQEMAKFVPELPFSLYDHPQNPYPVVEFTDSVTAGQFWGPTVVEQLIDLQREYNFVRGLIRENLRDMARPKILVYKQHNLADGAWTNSSGEIVELNWTPGLPPPQILQPANVAADAWNLLALIGKEFDDLTQIYPAGEGKAGQATSGFQTSLLQEAADSVHAPDIREDELAIEEAGWKIRRLMKLGYDVPRLISLLGANSAPEVMEFCSDQIDEFAEVRVQAGSMLPDMKAAKIQTIQEMYKSGLFGNPQDQQVRRRVLEMVEMGGLEIVQDEERRDSDQAWNENMTIMSGGGVAPAQQFEDHITHLYVHASHMKSPEVLSAPDPLKHALMAHYITHIDFTNPTLAWGLRQQYNLAGLPIATPPLPPPPPMPMQGGPTSGPMAPPSPQGPAIPQTHPPAPAPPTG